MGSFFSSIYLFILNSLKNTKFVSRDSSGGAVGQKKKVIQSLYIVMKQRSFQQQT